MKLLFCGFNAVFVDLAAANHSTVQVYLRKCRDQSNVGTIIMIFRVRVVANAVIA